MIRKAILLSHDRPAGPGVMRRLAQAFLPHAEAVHLGLPDDAPVAGPSPAEAGQGLHHFGWRLPWLARAERGALMRLLTAPAIDLWAALPQPGLEVAAKDASIVVLQAGPAVALVARLREVAPGAEIVCFADEPFDRTCAHPRLLEIVERDAALVDRAVTSQRVLLPGLGMFGRRAELVPYGLDAGEVSAASPYGPGPNVVAIGGRSFDSSVVQVAAACFPGITVHLLGDATEHRFPDNVVRHATRGPAEAVAYLRHADAAIVADFAAAEQTADSGGDLAVLDHFGVPVVCPLTAIDGHPHRFGYEPGRSASMKTALDLALRVAPHRSEARVATWDMLACRVLGGVPSSAAAWTAGAADAW